MENLFKPSVVAQLAEAARLKPKKEQKKIASKLSELAHSFLLKRLWQEKPPPSAITKRLKAIRSAADALAQKLPADTPSDSEVRFRLTAQAAVKASTQQLTDLASGHERLRLAIAMLGELADWSRSAEKREGARKGRKPGHEGDPAMQSLVNGLAEVWLDHWDKLPGTSRSEWTKESYGPFVRFVQAYLTILESKLTAADLEQDQGLRDALSKARKPEAIRDRAQKSPVAKILDWAVYKFVESGVSNAPAICDELGLESEEVEEILARLVKKGLLVPSGKSNLQKT